MLFPADFADFYADSADFILFTFPADCADLSADSAIYKFVYFNAYRQVGLKDVLHIL